MLKAALSLVVRYNYPPFHKVDYFSESPPGVNVDNSQDVQLNLTGYVLVDLLQPICRQSFGKNLLPARIMEPYQGICYVLSCRF
jgi:hypothetical protein